MYPVQLTQSAAGGDARELYTLEYRLTGGRLLKRIVIAGAALHFLSASRAAHDFLFAISFKTSVRMYSIKTDWSCLLPRASSKGTTDVGRTVFARIYLLHTERLRICSSTSTLYDGQHQELPCAPSTQSTSSSHDLHPWTVGQRAGGRRRTGTRS